MTAHGPGAASTPYDILDMPGDLVPAAVSLAATVVHASPLDQVLSRPDLGLAPWNPPCNSTWATVRRPDAEVTCRTCLWVMTKRGVSLDCQTPIEWLEKGYDADPLLRYAGVPRRATEPVAAGGGADIGSAPTNCRICGGDIGWIDCPTGGWWAHVLHPGDNHEAEPIEGRGR